MSKYLDYEGLKHYNDKLNAELASLEAKLNENIIKNPEKTYLAYQGDVFNTAKSTNFQPAEGVVIDWGDGTTFVCIGTDAPITHNYTDGINCHLISISGATSIGYYWFANYAGILSAALGNTITVIDRGAFAYCSNLIQITIPETVNTILGHAFERSGLRNVIIPKSVTEIGAYAFSQTALRTIAILGNITSLGDNAFSLNSDLTDISIYGNIDLLAGGCFRQNTRLKNLGIYGNIGVCEEGSDFTACYDLSTVTFRGNVEEVPSFSIGKKLREVRFLGTVKTIPGGVFGECPKLQILYFSDKTPAKIGKSSYTDNIFTYTKKIVVPKDAIDTYKSAVGWSEYADKIVYEVDSSDLDKAITDLDVDNIAYKNKANTFGAVQEFAEDLLLYPGTKLRDYDDNYFDFYKFQKRTGSSTFATINLPDGSGTLALIEDIQALNIQNGTGLDSLVQKYSGEVDATHFGNTCNGESAAIFGEANFNSGNRTLISGKMNRTSAPNSLIVGLGNGRGIDADPTIDVLSGEQLFVFGALNSVSNGNGNAVLGAENILSDVRYSTIIGRGNIIDNTSLYEGKCVVGRFNNQKPDTMFEVGVGDYNNRVNGFEVYKDGRAKVNTAPKDANDVVRKLELDTKYDKAGGTIGGNVVITGDLTVNGTQHINNTENLNVENAMIYSNANGATLATNGGIGIKKNATDVYGIVYDPTSDSVKLGIGKSDANGRFTFNANEGQPVAIRDDSAQLTNNHIIKWDSTNHKLVDSGKSVDDFVNLTDNQTISGIKTFSNAANFKGATSIDGLVTAKAGITTTKIESTTGAGSYDVRSGQFTNGSAENVIKLPQKAGTIALDGDLVTTPITETETVVVDTTTVNFALDAEHDTGMYVSAENAISLSSTQLQWNDGRQKYKVIWDGVEYICYVQSTTNPKYNDDGTYGYYDWQILGNGNNKLNCYNKDTNIYPFAITQDRWKNSAEWLIYATTSTAATHTIKVIKVEGTYKKVTPEYQYDYLSMLKNGRSNNTLLHGYSLDDDGLSAGILSGDGNQYVNDVPVGDNYDRHLVIFGDANRVHRYEATGESHDATIMGLFNELHLKGTGFVRAPSISGAYNILTNNTKWLAPFVTGYSNSITANKGTIHPDAVFGSKNKLTYDGYTTYGLNLVGGNNHTIKNVTASLITGLGNTVECLDADKYIGANIVGGQQNTVNHGRVIIGGGGNTSDRNNQFIAGTYSAANEKAIVKIGNGTKDARANAFEVLDDNRAKVFGTPTENNDVLRYQDTAVEVETSLMGA